MAFSSSPMVAVSGSSPAVARASHRVQHLGFLGPREQDELEVAALIAAAILTLTLTLTVESYPTCSRQADSQQEKDDYCSGR